MTGKPQGIYHPSASIHITRIAKYFELSYEQEQALWNDVLIMEATVINTANKASNE